MPTDDERQKDREQSDARMAIESAVFRALEKGVDEEDVHDVVDTAIDEFSE